MASAMVAQAYNIARLPLLAPQKRGITHSPCLAQQTNQKRRRRSNNWVRFNCTLMIGSCAQNYDRSPIARCTRLSKEEMMELYREKLENIPLMNWSSKERVRFFERMAAKQANAAKQAKVEQARQVPKVQAEMCLEEASEKGSVVLQARKVRSNISTVAR
jgi:hypothetical protein